MTPAPAGRGRLRFGAVRFAALHPRSGSLRTPRTCRAVGALLSLLLLLTLPRGARADDEPPSPRPAEPGGARPRVVLVLSGGGARGAAHVGVLKVLEEMRVPVDLVVGTSMGAIVGGLYASGWEPEEIQKMMDGLNWRDLFTDQVRRGDKTFRRKQDDDVFLVASRLRFKGWKPVFPTAFLTGQHLDLLFDTLEIETTSETDFNRFPIPFRAVAADLATGEPVVLDHGSLATALRASMSIAGVFPPVEVDGRMLVDGGAAANLPVRIARELGADRIIAVDITTRLQKEEKLNSLLSIINQMTSLLTTANRREDVESLRKGDVLIQPDLGDITYTDLERTGEAIRVGEEAARSMEDRLRPFSVSEEAYARYREAHRRRPRRDFRIDRVDLVNESWVDDRLVERRLPREAGRTFDEAALREGILRLSALDYFGVIREDYRRSGDEGILTVRTPAKPYGRNSVQFGFSFQDDFQGENGYSLAARHLLLAANRRGGEWENVGQIGDRALLRSLFYQPLDLGMRWFASAGGEMLRENLTVWENQNPTADFRMETNEARLAAGRVLGDWGEARVEAYSARNLGHARVGVSSVPDFDERDAGFRLVFRTDTRDEVVFPRHGGWTTLRYDGARPGLGSDFTRDQAWLFAERVWSFGRNTLAPSVEAFKTLEGTATLVSSYRLGGPGRLSGLAPDQLLGEKGGLARLGYYRELTHLELGALSARVYAGATMEAGDAYPAGDPVTAGSLRHGGSIYLGAQTAIGPASLGIGFADGGERRVYFQLGQRF